MVEVLQNFEQVAGRFDSAVLIGFGVLAVLLGLLIWLGGFGVRKLLFLIVGAISGGICGSSIIGQNVAATILLAGLAAVLSATFEKVFVPILAAALIFCLAVAFLAQPYLEQSSTPMYIVQDKPSDNLEPISSIQSWEITRAYANNFVSKFKYACLQMPMYNWMIIILVVAIAVAAGRFFWCLTCILCCELLGVSIIFAGIISLLLYKGAQPLSFISDKLLICTGIFAAMTVFGTVEQLIIFRLTKRKLVGKKEAKKIEPEQKTSRWRTS